MEYSRPAMIDYLLYFCKTCDEYDKEKERLNALTDEALEAEFTTEYNSLEGACPDLPLSEGNTPDLYLDF